MLGFEPQPPLRIYNLKGPQDFGKGNIAFIVYQVQLYTLVALPGITAQSQSLVTIGITDTKNTSLVNNEGDTAVAPAIN